MNIFCDAKGNIFYADAEKIYQGAVGVNEICFIGEFPSSAQVLMAYKLPNGDYKAPIMLTRVHGFNEVQLSNGGKWTMWKGRVGAVPQIEDGKYVTDENGNIVYDLDHTITEYSGTASVRFFVYGSNGRVATEEVNFTIEKGLPVYLDAAELQTSDAERLLEQILAAVENVYEQDNTLEEKVDTLYNEVKTNINVLYSDTNDNRTAINGLREQVNSFVENDNAKVVLDVTLTEAQAGANSVAVAIQDIDALVNAKRLFMQIRVPNKTAVAANKCWFTVLIADKNKSVYNSAVHTGYNLALSANKTVDIIANIFISTLQTQDRYYSYQSVCQPANDHLSASANSKTNAVTINGIIALGVIKESASVPPYLHIASSDTGAIPFVAGTRFYMEAY